MACADSDVQALPFNAEIDLPNTDSREVNKGSAPASVKGSRLEDQSLKDELKMITSKLVSQNNTILSQISRIATDVDHMSKDLMKVSRSVSKLVATQERNSHATNVLSYEFQTFSQKVISSLRALQGSNAVFDGEQVDPKRWNIYFHGEDNVFSNFYPSTLEADGHVFYSAEHAYQYEKALVHGLADTAGVSILKARHGGGAKAVANRNIPHVSKEWDQMKGDVMMKVLRWKAAQCQEFRDELLDTGDCPLIHDLPSYEWGWGNSACQGKNMMGTILEKLRAELKQGLIKLQIHSQEFDCSYEGQTRYAVETKRAESYNTPANEGHWEDTDQSTTSKRERMKEDNMEHGDKGKKYHGSEQHNLPERTVTKDDRSISVKVLNQPEGGKPDHLHKQKTVNERRDRDSTSHHPHQENSETRDAMQSGSHTKASSGEREESSKHTDIGDDSYEGHERSLVTQANAHSQGNDYTDQSSDRAESKNDHGSATLDDESWQLNQNQSRKFPYPRGNSSSRSQRFQRYPSRAGGYGRGNMRYNQSSYGDDQRNYGDGGQGYRDHNHKNSWSSSTRNNSYHGNSAAEKRGNRKPDPS